MPSPAPAHYIVYTDGGARGNPGPAAAGVVVYDSVGKLVLKSGQFLGIATNNEAEYRAVIHALECLKNLPSFSSGLPQLFEFRLDSQLVARQLSGQYKLKNERLIPLAAKVHSLLGEHLATALFVSIPRAQNSKADALVNQVLDSTPQA